VSFVHDHKVGIEVLAADQCLDARDLDIVLRIRPPMVSLDDAVLEPELIKAPTALLDELCAMGEEDGALALTLHPVDDGAGDGGLARTGRGDEEDAPISGADLLPDGLQRAVLVSTKSYGHLRISRSFKG
jgi:hypothetical protein